MRMGRRQQANARTLSFAVRKLFQPVLTDVNAFKTGNLGSGSLNGADSSSNHKDAYPNTSTIANHSYSTELISTQPDDDLVPSIAVTTKTSDKSLGKRKRAEEADQDCDTCDDGQDRSRRDNPAMSLSDQVIQTHYTQDNLPPALQKYWWQRYRLFSRYDEGIQMDYDGWFSVTPENVAAQIAERCRCEVIVDAFCGVGGNAIQFALTCEKVIAIDNSPVRLACARANAKIYGVEDRITFVLADYVQWAKARIEDTASGKEQEEIEVIFMSPPWGGIEYQEELPNGDPNQSAAPVSTMAVYPSGPYASYSLARLAPLHGKQLFDLSRKLTKNIAYFLPRNLDLEEAAALVPSTERVECEEEWMGSKLKALTFYYGDLVPSNVA